MVDARITAILLDRFTELEAVYTLAMPGIDFTPPNGPFLRADLFPASTAQISVGNDGFNRHEGILQVSVFWPAGEGIVAAQIMAADVVEHFKRGTDMAEGDTVVRVLTPPALGAPVYEPGWMQIPITIRWQSDNPNP